MRTSRPIVTALVIAIVMTLVVAAQVSAHYRTPNTSRKLKHDLRHLDGFATRLVGDAFVDGNAQIMRARKRITETVDTQKTMLNVPGMGPVQLRKETSFFDCSVTLTNESGQAITRNGMARSGGSSTVAPVPPTVDAQVNSGQAVGLISTDGQEESAIANYHISTADLSKVMVVDVALNQGLPPGAATDCAATVVITFTTM